MNHYFFLSIINHASRNKTKIIYAINLFSKLLQLFVDSSSQSMAFLCERKQKKNSGFLLFFLLNWFFFIKIKKVTFIVYLIPKQIITLFFSAIFSFYLFIFIFTQNSSISQIKKKKLSIFRRFFFFSNKTNRNITILKILLKDFLIA